MKLLLATGNAGKVRDLRSLLNGEEIEILSLADFPDIPEVVEDGSTFLDNARKKAHELYRATGLPTLADDSGLEVEALDGRPGVYSARYAGEPFSDARNVAKVLADLEDCTDQRQRRARFHCSLVYLNAEGREYVTSGKCEGVLAHEPVGENGFGYDPLFVHPKFGGLTMAQVGRELKNSVSHRGEAFRLMLENLLYRG